MSLWDDLGLEGMVTAILRDVRDRAAEHHFGCPFFTAYQLAIALADRYPEAAEAIGMPIGGRGTGQHTSLPQYLARQLSRCIASGHIRHIEGAFLSTKDVEHMRFTGGVASSSAGGGPDLSMFRLRDSASDA